MTDELEKLSDAALSEAFAVEVAGYVKSTFTNKLTGEHKCYRNDGVIMPWPKFATSADAITPFLEKQQEVSCVCENGRWFVGIDDHDTSLRKFVCATAPTFARAAALALLRAARAAKGVV